MNWESVSHLNQFKSLSFLRSEPSPSSSPTGRRHQKRTVHACGSLHHELHLEAVLPDHPIRAMVAEHELGGAAGAETLGHVQKERRGLCVKGGREKEIEDIQRNRLRIDYLV